MSALQRQERGGEGQMADSPRRAPTDRRWDGKSAWRRRSEAVPQLGHGTATRATQGGKPRHGVASNKTGARAGRERPFAEGKQSHWVQRAVGTAWKGKSGCMAAALHSNKANVSVGQWGQGRETHAGRSALVAHRGLAGAEGIGSTQTKAGARSLAGKGR